MQAFLEELENKPPEKPVAPASAAPKQEQPPPAQPVQPAQASARKPAEVKPATEHKTKQEKPDDGGGGWAPIRSETHKID
jgi:ribosomal protein L12E/L44/L45/RPP1/RPP2